jgi:hypothetical protein
MRDQWKHNVYVEGLLTYSEGGVHYLFGAMLGEMCVRQVYKYLCEKYNINKINEAMYTYIFIKWLNYLEELGCLEPYRLSEYNLFNVKAYGRSPAVWEFDYYSNKVYADKLLFVLVIMWFGYLITILFSV